MPDVSAPHLSKALNNTPVGTLADFSLDASAIPFDPRDSSAQIPTLSATVADLAVPVNSLIDDEVTFRDWTGSDTRATVKSVRGAASSGLTSLDTSTLYDRLNTVQTTFPLVFSDGGVDSTVLATLTHWCLMAGVPLYSTPGNLLLYVPTRTPGTIGYVADNPAALRFFGPPDSRYAFVPTIGTYLPPIEVNASQSMILGANFDAQTQVAEFRIHAFRARTQQDVIYTVRKLDNTYSVVEKVGSGAETVLLTATHTSTTTWQHNVNVLVKANTADPTKIDLTLRVLESGEAVGGPGVDTYTDYTATSKTSTLTERPLPFKFELGYDAALVGARTAKGVVDGFFLSEGATLPERFPLTQVDITSLSEPEVRANEPRKIPGFTANVWDKIKEFCAITEMDVAFARDSIVFRPRYQKVLDGSGNPLPPLTVTKSDLSWGVDNRETSKYVDVVYREMVGDEDQFTSTELWRADTVYSLDKGEYKEEVVQSNSTFTVLGQPLAVSSVPVPYSWGYGSYVVTGNDGYIVEPQWWLDNGGYIKVEATGTAGEIKIRMQAPALDTARAPYRLSEGVADRPALYIVGNGLNLGEEKTLRIATGAGDAAQEAVTFDSPFVTNLELAYNVGYKVADSMGGAGGHVSFGIPKSTLLAQDQYSETEYDSVPMGSMVYQGGAIHRITSMSVRPSGLSVGKADQFTSIAATNDGLGPDATVEDWNNLHLNKTVKEVNLSPLPQYVA